MGGISSTTAKLVPFSNNPPQMLQLTAQNWKNKEDLFQVQPIIKGILSNFQIRPAPLQEGQNNF